MPEYALLVAIVGVGLLAVVGQLEDAVGDDISAHGATAGAPDLPDLGIPTTTANTTPPTTSGATTTTLAIVNATASVTDTNNGASPGNKWDPSFDVHAVNTANGSTLTTVTITVTWTYTKQNGQVETVNSTCAAPASGTCSFQLNNLSSNAGNPQCAASVTATITGITSSSSTINYTSGSVSTTIAGPNPCI